MMEISIIFKIAALDYGARTGLKTQWKGGNDFSA